MSQYVVSIDIAKRRDFTAIQIYRDTPELIRGDKAAHAPDRQFHYQDLVYQFKGQDMRYQDLAMHVVRLLSDKKVNNNNDLIVDGTGVGVAVVDIFRERGLNPIPIVATSGGTARPVYADIGNIFGTGEQLKGMQTVSEWHVPKVEMVQAGQVAMEQRLVRIAPNVNHLDDFREQLQGFKGRFNEKTNYTRYDAEDDDVHDDFITCYLMAMWWIRTKSENTLAQRLTGEKDNTTWSPMDRWRRDG